MSLDKLNFGRFVIPLILLPLIVVGILLILESTQSFYFLYDDNTVLFLPYFGYNWRALIEHGAIPFINFHQYLGHAYIGNGSSAVLYLPVYLSAFVSIISTGDIYYTIDVLAFIHLALASIGMYFLLQRLNVSYVISFLISILWVTFPFVINVSRTWIFVSITSAFLPFNFLFLDKLLTDPRARNALYLSLIKAFFLFAGYIQYLFMTVVFEIFYIIILLLVRYFSPKLKTNKDKQTGIPADYTMERRPFLKFAKSYLLSMLFFLLLSAPLLIPMIFSQQDSALRSTKVTLLNFLSWSMPWSDFLSAQFLNFKENVIFGGDSEIFYFGLLNLLLIIPIIFKRCRKDLRNIAFVLLAGVALICSTELYRIFYYIPGFNLFRWPFKNFILFLFFASIAVAGIANLISLYDTKRAQVLKFGVYSVLSFSVILNCYVLSASTTSNHLFASMHIDDPPNLPLQEYISKHDGRIFSLWINKIKSKDRYKYFTYNFASLFDYLHFGGYDIMVSALNRRLALGLNHLNSYGGMFDRRLLNYLSFTGARYIVAPDNEYTRRLEGVSQLRLRYRHSNIVLYENLAALPLVYYPEDISKPVRFRFGINEINIYPSNARETNIAVNVAPLRWFYIYLDGIKEGPINTDEYPIKIKLPANTQKVTLKYVDYPFYAGVLFFSLFWVGIVLYGIYTRFRRINS